MKKEKLYKCLDCGKGYAIKKRCTQHMEKKHQLNEFGNPIIAVVPFNVSNVGSLNAVPNTATGEPSVIIPPVTIKKEPVEVISISGSSTTDSEDSDVEPSNIVKTADVQLNVPSPATVSQDLQKQNTMAELFGSESSDTDKTSLKSFSSVDSDEEKLLREIKAAKTLFRSTTESLTTLDIPESKLSSVVESTTTKSVSQKTPAKQLVLANIEVNDPAVRKATRPNKILPAQCFHIGRPRISASPPEPKLTPEMGKRRRMLLPRAALVEIADVHRQDSVKKVAEELSQHYQWTPVETQQHLRRLADIRAGQVSEMQRITSLLASEEGSSDPGYVVRELRANLQRIKKPDDVDD